MEKNDTPWGAPTDEFMFRKHDIDIQGTQFSQTHMYGYAMFGKDLFVNIHISKINPTPEEQAQMVAMLNSLKKIGTK